MTIEINHSVPASGFPLSRIALPQLRLPSGDQRRFDEVGHSLAARGIRYHIRFKNATKLLRNEKEVENRVIFYYLVFVLRSLFTFYPLGFIHYVLLSTFHLKRR
jgi:hypothetical protein